MLYTLANVLMTTGNSIHNLDIFNTTLSNLPDILPSY